MPPGCEAAWPTSGALDGATMCRLNMSYSFIWQQSDSRCRQTGQYHPLAFFFLLSRPVVVVPPATGGAFAAAVPEGVDDPPAAAPVSTSTSSRLATLPPAPNSTIPTAHSRQTTKCRHGRRTTSRGEVRQTIHSLGVDANGSSAPEPGG